jgi:DNA helicase-2/ATP-dependent DNA helicase PcrA
MLVVVYNHALESYIGKVLPSLGMAGVRTVTFERWAASLRRRHVRGLPDRTSESTPLAVSRAKKHPRMLAVLAEAASRVDGRGPGSVVEAWAEALTDADLLRRHLCGPSPRPLPSRDVEALVDWCVRQQRAIDEAEDLDESEAWLDVEDDALLLRLYQLLRGPLRSSSNKPLLYEHLMVDEAQDLSPLELAVLLGTASRRASITFAGDAAQRLDLDSGFGSWTELFAELELDPLTVSPLAIGYRSTAEIMDFARAVLGPLADPETTYLSTRSGAPVELLRFSHDGEAVAVLAEALRELAAREPLASVALVARHPERADVYFEGLRRSEIPRLRRVADQDFCFKPGVEVTDVRQVKGLEFDYVVLLDADAASYPATDAARHLLHIGATRAAHQLWLVATATPSPLLPGPLLDGVAGA